MTLSSRVLSLNDLGVSVTPAQRIEEQLFKVRHGENYSFLLYNLTRGKVRAHFWIDGDFQFKIIVHPTDRDGVELTCNPDTKAKFAAFASGTQGAAATGESALSQSEKGLIVIKFQPESAKLELEEPFFLGLYDDEDEDEPLQMFGSRFTSAVTGYSGTSNQQFGTTSFVGEPNDDLWTILQFRLVADKPKDDGVTPISPRRAEAVRKLNTGVPPIV